MPQRHTSAIAIVCVRGPCEVAVPLLELFAEMLDMLETVEVGEGDVVGEFVGVGVDDAVAGAVLSWANPTAAMPRKRASDRRILGSDE